MFDHEKHHVNVCIVMRDFSITARYFIPGTLRGIRFPRTVSHHAARPWFSFTAAQKKTMEKRKHRARLLVQTVLLRANAEFCPYIFFLHSLKRVVGFA